MENELKTKFFLFLDEVKRCKKMQNDLYESLGLSAMYSQLNESKFEILALHISRLIRFLDEEKIEYKLEKTPGGRLDNYTYRYRLHIEYGGDTFEFYDYNLKE